MISIRPARDDDFFPWLTVYEGYAAFYRAPLTDERAVRTWQWITRGDHGLRAFLAVDEADAIVGLAHVRTVAQPLEGTTGLFLDDLFVTEAARGRGVATALLEHFRALAIEEGRSGVSWITAEDNHTAQRVYDRVARRTTWLTYEMPAESSSDSVTPAPASAGEQEPS